MSLYVRICKLVLQYLYKHVFIKKTTLVKLWDRHVNLYHFVNEALISATVI